MCRMKGLFVISGLVSVCVLLVGASMASADLVNESFETPDIPSGTKAPQGQAPTSWAAISDPGHMSCYLMDSIEGGPAKDGTQWIQVQKSYDLFQNTGIALQDGYTYSLAFSARSDRTAAVGAQVMLRAADDTSSAGTAFATDAFSAIGGGEIAWGDRTLQATYTGDSGKYLSVSIGVPSTTTGWVDYDALHLTIQSPEPAALTLVALGLLSLLAYAWRKRR
jgi:hypothetical protein